MKSLHELMSLNGRVALITGGAGHLGRTMASSLAECGADIVIADRSIESCRSVTSALEAEYGIRTLDIAIDLEQEKEVEALPGIVMDHFGHMDILLNNAAFVGTSGLKGWATRFEEQSTETWRRAMEVNLTACFTLCRKSSTFLRASQHGSIINVGSIYGIVGPDLSLYDGTTMGNPAAYAASKGGLLQLTRWLATTLAPHIRVNAISPGGVWRNQPKSFVERYEKRTPLGRMATEEDFKGVIAWLASDASAYVTGQNIQIDGGWDVW